MIAFETAVRINRPIDEVFTYVSDPLNFPRWNSAVEAVRKTSAADGGVISTYSMERQLPTGRAVNQLDLYRYRFSGEEEETVVSLDAEVDVLGGAALLPPIARRLVKNGVDVNFATLKQVLETACR
jgi:Polyketide cyclase / dehydrase and lipid transport